MSDRMTKELYRNSEISVVLVRQAEFERLREYQIQVQPRVHRHWFLENLKECKLFKRLLKDPETMLLATTGSGSIYPMDDYFASSFCKGSLERCENLIKQLEESFGGDTL